MPMNFPDFQSLKDVARARGFRQPKESVGISGQMVKRWWLFWIRLCPAVDSS